ncbi:aromatic prenyltransferase [Annulohypoxylon moriforme]|nr:aromatic prenyltransferase [Annulohypoxylon moriforme]
MATQISTPSSFHPEAPAAEAWSKHAHSTLGLMLSSTGTYAASVQASYLQFFDEHVAARLRPAPVGPKVKYPESPDFVGIHFEVSLNLTARGEAKVRYNFDLKRDIAGPDSFGENSAREVLHYLCSATGGDPKLMDRLMDAFFLSESETAALRDKVPPLMHIPAATIGFELGRSQQTMKAYLPIIKKTIMGQSPVVLTNNALRDLEPLGYDLSHNATLLIEYLTSRQDKVMPIMFGIDCLDPKVHQGSRVKVYLKAESNTFAMARDVMTLGGRLSDETTVKKVDLLRSIWHLLYNEPNGIPDDEIDTWSKPMRTASSAFRGFLFSVDLAAGRKKPDIKTYVPVFQYAENNETVLRNTNAALKMLNHEWGQSGRYYEVNNAVFGQQNAHVMSYAAFSYSESKGMYLNSYFSMPILNAEKAYDFEVVADAGNIMD